MWLKINTRFRYRSIAVFIFLFLNFFLAAAPFINAASVNVTVVNATGPISQNHASDQEENNHLSHLLENKHEYHHSTRSKQRVPGISCTSSQQDFSFIATIDQPARKYASSSFLVRPAYYRLLFLHHLF
ncbi:hypothetical protein [Terrimonas pollutisoli]|uniref:hypothetical protein n=1 Tax=Terrimonas pollutisoli TaxID=3034147 RepID=UPI0023EB2B39|nr:hypothetical protein [Terrimonas sp. H1YJ31]